MSDASHQCLFESGIDGYNTYRIPALVVSAAGTILAFCEARKFTPGDYDTVELFLRRSFDNGRTWAPRQLLVADGDRTCGNPCPVVDGDTIWLPFTKDNQQVFVIHSTDDGASWSELAEITASVRDPAWTYIGTGPGHGIRLQSGRLLIPSWVDEGTGPASSDPNDSVGGVQSSYIIYSDDHGATWQHGPLLNRGVTNECEVAERTDGTVQMTLRGMVPERRRGHSWSHDGGDTWSPVVFDDNLPQSDCQGSIITLENGTIMLAHPSDPKRRARLALYKSVDDGWSEAAVLRAGAAAYSDLAIAGDGTLLCLYEYLTVPEGESEYWDDRYAKLMLARYQP